MSRARVNCCGKEEADLRRAGGCPFFPVANLIRKLFIQLAKDRGVLAEDYTENPFEVRPGFRQRRAGGEDIESNRGLGSRGWIRRERGRETHRGQHIRAWRKARVCFAGLARPSIENTVLGSLGSPGSVDEDVAVE